MTKYTQTEPRIHRRSSAPVFGIWATALVFMGMSGFMLHRALTGGDGETAMVAGTMLAFDLIFLFLCYTTFGVLVCDERGIAYRNIGFSKRIQFADVTRTVYEPGKFQLTLYSLDTRINCGREYQDIESLIAFVDAHLPEGLPEGDSAVSEAEKQGPVTCRYPKSRWIIILVSMLLLELAWWSLMMVEYDIFAMPLRWLVFLLLPQFLIVSVFVHGAWSTSKRLVVSEEGVVHSTLLRKRAIAFDTIFRAERYIANGEERFLIHYSGGRLSCHAAMEGYGKFVSRLAEYAPVRWRNEDALRFPVEISLRRHAVLNGFWMIFSLVSAALCAYGCYYFYAWAEEREWPLVGLLALVAVLMAGFGILCLRALLIRPRGYVFHRDHFAVQFPKTTLRVSSEDIQEIGVYSPRHWNPPTRELQIRFKEKSFEILTFETSLPLDPLCALLRDAYFGEREAANPRAASEASPGSQPEPAD